MGKAKTEGGVRSGAKGAAAEAEKREKGQYFTRGNPFGGKLFAKWARGLGDSEILEPFAGACHIPKSLAELGYGNAWRCFDLEPPKRTEAGMKVERRDTLADFPKGFKAAATNPPYLAKNSAARRKIAYPKEAEGFDDLYKAALAKMLENVERVAAIVPESFLTQGQFEERLFGVASLSGRLFEDTEHPVCLALFVPAEEAPADYEIWRDDERLGLSRELRAARPQPKARGGWKFNDPKGAVGIRCVDGTSGDSIEFVEGAEVDPAKVKPTSRLATRASPKGGLSAGDAKRVAEEAGKILKAYRAATADVEMTSFKGLRSDGRYRRRLDYELARDILDEALCRLGLELKAQAAGAGEKKGARRGRKARGEPRPDPTPKPKEKADPGLG